MEACNELLATPLMMQQWVEEADRDDELIPLKKRIQGIQLLSSSRWKSGWFMEERTNNHQ